ncbi:MAG: hypothetical protein JXA71_17390 [Chitinispirillaceae bacterium]|nr:hypothetical protein [Chitinispirillaceae bacterium]
MSRLPSTLLMTGMIALLLLCGQNDKKSPPVAIALVPEMSCIHELEAWSTCASGAFAKDSIAVAREWKTLTKRIEKQFSAESVRSLSKWARPQMEDYSRTPRLDGVAFSPLRVDPERNLLLLHAVADTLPTHEKVVTRSLTLYLLFDRKERKVRHVTVTIRGDVAE